MLSRRLPQSLADAEVTLSGVMHSLPQGVTRLPLEAALQLSLEVVRMVAEAHDKGQVVGVLDAAHLVCGQSGALAFGRGPGSPVAPELARGDAPDRLSDVYCLGALMYRLLTGRKVELGKLIEPPSHFNPAVESALDGLLLEVLDEDPSERPYSARVLEARLLEVFAELGLLPSSPSLVLAPHREPVATPPRPVAKREHAQRAHPQRGVEDEEHDADEAESPAPTRQLSLRIRGFFYDLGWLNERPAAVAVAPVDGEAPVDDQAPVDDERRKRRNRLSQFMYDLGWLQNIDWDAPRTLQRLKWGAAVAGLLLVAFIAFPSKRPTRLTAAQAALVAVAHKEAGGSTRIELAPKIATSKASPTPGKTSRR